MIFGTNEECIEVKSHTKFAVNMMNIQGVVNVYSRKKIEQSSAWLQGKPTMGIT